MAKNITLMGASYSDVPAVTLPKTGGGTARFDDASVTTATASDVAQGKVFLAADGQITTGTASGGGGASNVVTGTFTGTTTGAAMDVNIPYTGTGYPIAVMVYPSAGVRGDDTFYALVQRYACAMYCASKTDTASQPTYQNTDYRDEYFLVQRYKNSASSPTSYSQTASSGTAIAQQANAYANSTNLLRIKSATKLSVFIASTSYGFAANIEYTYVVQYSS